jgi:hypothetical protein
MNETQIILTSIVAFGVGYYLAFFAKNLSTLAKRYGFFIIFAFPLVMGALRFALKYHPDRHKDKSPEELRELNIILAEINKAYEWLKGSY